MCFVVRSSLPPPRFVISVLLTDRICVYALREKRGTNYLEKLQRSFFHST